MTLASRAMPRVVIVGGGFGGLAAARALGPVAVDVTLIDRRNFHLFQPLRRQRDVDIVLGEARGFDVARRLVLLEDDSIAYDHLVVAAGATHSYFGKSWEALAPGLKTIEDAIEIRRRVLLAFERASSSPSGRLATWRRLAVSLHRSF